MLCFSFHFPKTFQLRKSLEWAEWTDKYANFGLVLHFIKQLLINLQVSETLLVLSSNTLLTAVILNIHWNGTSVKLSGIHSAANLISYSKIANHISINDILVGQSRKKINKLVAFIPFEQNLMFLERDILCVGWVNLGIIQLSSNQADEDTPEVTYEIFRY